MKPLFHIKPPRRRRRSSRWMLVLLVLIAVSMAVGYQVLTATEELPPFEGPLAPFAEVTPVEGVEVCWLETASMQVVDATASSLLIRHPQGIVLIDAGTSLHLDEEIAPYEGIQKLFMRLGPGGLKAERPLSAVLGDFNVKPSQLKAVIATHAHIDHVGGARELPSVPVWAAEEELIFARNEAQAAAPSFHVMDAHAKLLAARGRPIAFTPTEHGPFERSADLFGDGTVQVVPMPGHTPGSVGVFVVLPDGRRLLTTGDAINRMAELMPARSKRRVMASTDVDPTAAHAMVSRLAKLKQVDPTLEWLPAHERSAWAKVFERPGRCLGGQRAAAAR